MIKDLFAVPILHENIILQGSNLYEQIKAARAKKNPSSHNYTSYFKSPSDNSDNRMEGVDWSELETHIHRCSKEYIKAVFPQAKWYNTKIDNIWWNLYGLNNHHCWHIHPASLLSGTYYVHMDDLSAPVSFKSPIMMLLSSTYHNKYGSGTKWSQLVTIKAKTGDLLMWPSWLEHAVPEQTRLSENARCSISFNVIQH